MDVVVGLVVDLEVEELAFAVRAVFERRPLGRRLGCTTASLGAGDVSAAPKAAVACEKTCAPKCAFAGLEEVVGDDFGTGVGGWSLIVCSLSSEEVASLLLRRFLGDSVVRDDGGCCAVLVSVACFVRNWRSVNLEAAFERELSSTS